MQWVLSVGHCWPKNSCRAWPMPTVGSRSLDKGNYGSSPYEQS
jgi:hypothetical protein